MSGRWLPQAILGAASLIAPPDQRAEWFREWRSEFWYIPESDATRFCLGAFQDALYLRRNCQSPLKRGLYLESPLVCLSFLAILAAASVLTVAWLRVPLPGTSLLVRTRNLLGACAGMLLFSSLLLPGTVAVWRRPAYDHRMLLSARLRPGVFLALKVALLQPTVLCAFLLQFHFLPKGGFGGIGFNVIFIMIFRWVISDQQQRCPVCLHSLTPPVRIGTLSRTFLDWCGAESACPRGHGLLHTSETAFSYSRKAQWLALDDSWKDLFVKAGERHA